MQTGYHDSNVYDYVSRCDLYNCALCIYILQMSNALSIKPPSFARILFTIICTILILHTCVKFNLILRIEFINNLPLTILLIYQFTSPTERPCKQCTC